jgi:predicted DNA-binding transcriptional regulator AlpA
MKDEVLLDEAALKARGITYSRWHKNRLERAGKFPKRIYFGNRCFWLKSEIDAWIAERIAERDGGGS